MSKRFSFNRLTVSLMLSVVLAMGLAIGAYTLMQGVITLRVDTYFFSDEYQQKKSLDLRDSLQNYIDINQVSVSNLKPLEGWETKERFVVMSLYVGNRLVYATGMSPDSLSSAVDVEEQYMPDDLQTLSFPDGEAKLYIYGYADPMYFDLITLLSAAVAFALFVSVLVLLIHKKLRYISLMRQEIRILEGGDLTHPITLKGGDELYDLASGIDAMRVALQNQRAEEERARKAGQELVTAISHDLRTPLTGMLGYLDLVQQKKYKDEGDMLRFLSLAHKKGYQIKEMTDKLFDYFYVFDAAMEDSPLERVAAAGWMHQLLGEHIFELKSQGFQVETDLPPLRGDLMVHDTLFVRAVDNIFSNVLKYGDVAQPVHVACRGEKGTLTCDIVNKAQPDARADSTRIGLKTCRRAFEHHQGAFETWEEKGFFHVRFSLPLYPPLKGG